MSSYTNEHQEGTLFARETDTIAAREYNTKPLQSFSDINAT